jgi:hypothetical protein
VYDMCIRTHRANVVPEDTSGELRFVGLRLRSPRVAFAQSHMTPLPSSRLFLRYRLVRLHFPSEL